MRVAIDAKYQAVRRTGVQRYAVEMVQHLVALQPQRYHVLAPPWAGVGRQAAGIARRAVRWANNAWEQAWLPLRTAVGTYDLLYCPANMAPVFSRRVVAVLHDVIPLTHPAWFSSGFASWTRFMLPRVARHARWIITDSHASQAALLDVFPFLEDRLSVVYPGIGAQFQPAPTQRIDAMRRRYTLERPYLLFLSTLDPRKNLNRVLEAWRAAAAVEGDAELVVAGMTSEVFDGSGAMGRRLSGLPRVRWLGFVADEDLPALLSGSVALVYPSLDEGFGFPPLEVMACGRPAIVSAAGSLPEVCGEAGIYVDPTREDRIAEAMTLVLRDSAGLASRIAAGTEWAARFTWSSAAAQTDAILERLVTQP